MQQLQSGALDMGWIQAAELGSRVSQRGGHQRAVPRALDHQRREAGAHARRAEAARRAAARDRHRSAWAGASPACARCSRPRTISTLADLKGMKLRINPTPVYRDFYSAARRRADADPDAAACSTRCPTARSTGSRPTSSSRGTQRFDKVSKVDAADERAVHAVRAAGLGPHLAGLAGKPTRSSITDLVKPSLDAQINELATTEPKPDREVQGRHGADARRRRPPTRKPLIAEFDKLWLPKAPVIAELRKVGATLS